MSRRKARKLRSRSESIYARTSGQVTEITLSYDSENDSVRFATPIENTYQEVSYERVKRPKILNRTPLTGPDLTLDANDALQGFDLVVAVDTNTRNFGGRDVSVTGIIVGTWVIEGRTRSRAIHYRTPFCIEFITASKAKEKIGWALALTELAKREQFPRGAASALIVDAHLGDVPSMNAREAPLVDGFYLPQGITLLYASADAGAEYCANKLIRTADRVSSLVLNYINTGRTAPYNKALRGPPFKGYRLTFGKQVDKTRG